MTLLEIFAAIQQDAGITNSRFARYLGISPSLVTRIHNGERRVSEYVIVRMLVAYPMWRGRIMEAVQDGG